MKPRYMEHAEDALYWSLDEYAKHGIELGYVPTLRAVYGPEDSSDAYAAVRGEVENLNQASLLITAELERAKDKNSKWLRDMFSLTVSPEAMAEYISAVCETFENISVDSFQGEYILSELGYDSIGNGEIVLYFPFRMFRDHGKRKRIVAHELWHLIEKRYGVFSTTPLIVEGTATYAAVHLCGKEIEEHNLESIRGVVYQGSALIIQKRCKGDANPFKTILNNTFRQEAQEEFLAFIENLPPKLLLSVFDTPEYKKQLSITRAAAPELLPPENPTVEQYLTWLREMGANKIADELKSQDLTRYMVTVF